MFKLFLDRGPSSVLGILGPALALLLAAGCSGDAATGSRSGGNGSSGGGAGTSGAPNGAGSGKEQGGTSGAGGATGQGGIAGTGGLGAAPASGGQAGPSAGGGTARGGSQGTGGASGPSGKGGGLGSGGARAAVDGGAGDGQSGDVDCAATMPTGGTTKTGSSVYGTADGLNYGIWTNGDGGSITFFPNAHAFAASWSDSKDFLAHLGLDFNGSKSYAEYGTITAKFVEKKTGSAGGFSMIGMYGWMHNPCIEWYINEDSFNGLGKRGNVTATIDGGTYYLTTLTTTGTGGANACESGHTGSWTQMISTRSAARQCGVITVSDHFAAWAKQGWTLGNLTSVQINVEVGGGTGSIEFPVADVTTTSK